jgi:CheY-like chemotaxis protein
MKISVMIVDDDKAIAHCIDKVLSKAGHRVVHASNGVECLAALRAGFRGLVLMDIMMPQMDGWSTVRAAVREGLLTGNLVCMLTAVDDPGRAGEDVLEYVHDYLPKPFDNDELLGLVTSAMSCLGACA